jgi:acyl-coenzyme A synthetase/AMP-(fatty) acid ligase
METKLENYKIPKFIEQISEIPKTFNGKIDRKKLINR